MCLGLFDVEKHELIASTATDEHGRFEMPDVPNGDYRLVAQVGEVRYSASR